MFVYNWVGVSEKRKKLFSPSANSFLEFPASQRFYQLFLALLILKSHKSYYGNLWDIYHLKVLCYQIKKRMILIKIFNFVTWYFFTVCIFALFTSHFPNFDSFPQKMENFFLQNFFFLDPFERRLRSLDESTKVQNVNDRISASTVLLWKRINKIYIDTFKCWYLESVKDGLRL
jgi:hypothetical protein